MLPIQKKLTPYNYTAMSNKQNLYIVIHYVGGVSTAKNNVDYYAREKLSASATYFVDETSIWQCVEDYNRAWHCGGGLQGSGGHTFFKKCTNSNSIGIEMCCKKTSSGRWYFEDTTVKNTVELTKYLMKKYNIPVERVIRHYDVTGKICPEPYVRDETAWSNFKNMLINKEDEPMTAQEKASFDALVKSVSELSEKVNKLCNKMIYAWVDDNMPEWARPTISKLVQKGYLKGDDEGKLMLDDNMLRTLVILDRAGAFKE